MIIVKPPKDFEKLDEQTVDLPPSKYVANRLIIIAALAKGTSTLQQLPDNNDIKVALDGIAALGATCKEINKNDDHTFDVEITGFDGKPNPKLNSKSNSKSNEPVVYGGDNGTFSRLIALVLLLSERSVVLDASEQMRKRPMADLFDVMRKAGAKITCLEKEGFLPARIEGEYEGGELKLPGNISSQYFSALLLSAPYAKKDVTIIPTTPLVSLGYVAMTVEMMASEGVKVRVKSEWDLDSKFFSSFYEQLLGKNHQFYVKGGRKRTYHTNPDGYFIVNSTDVTAATYFIAMGSLGLRLCLYPFPISDIQGEAKFFEILRYNDLLRVTKEQKYFSSSGYMGDPPPARAPEYLYRSFKISVSKPDFLFDEEFLPISLVNDGALSVDVGNMPDAGPTFLALAVVYSHIYFAKSTIYNIEHLRHKESNRVEGMCDELRKIGADIEVGKNHIAVKPKKLDRADFEKAVLHSLGDHRLAMSFSLLSFVFPDVGICIDGEQSVAKTFPHYFECIKKLGFSVEKKSQ